MKRSICVFYLSTAFCCVPLLQAQQESSPAPPYVERMARAIEEGKSEAEIKDALYRSLIFELAHYNQIDAVKRLVSGEIDLEMLDQDGQTMLHIAVGNGSAEMTKILLDAGADVDGLNASQRSPLFTAAISNQLEIVKQLLAAKADVNGNSKHNSPLNAAAWYGYSEIAGLLIQHKANLKQTDGDGNTALHKAVWQGNVTIAEMLLEAGANLDVKNVAGQSPRSMAADRWKEKRESAADKRGYGEEQLIGAPDVAAMSDNPNAWCPNAATGQPQWLMLHFSKAVVPAKVEVYENMGPGTVAQVSVFDSKGVEHVAWKGKDPVKPNGNTVAVSRIDLKTEVKTKRIKLHIDINANSDWNEFDAVGLLDAKGNKQWVSWAEASSTYAGGQVAAFKHRRVFELIHGENDSD